MKASLSWIKMKASLSWIKELLPALKASPSGVARRLTSAGIEVEAMRALAASLEGVIVAEVRALAAHPQADSLRVATVFDGEGERTVVCGAPNVAVGQKVAFAPAGTTLPGGVRIERRAVRGVESEGMLCSEAELGVSDEASGLVVLKPRARPGKPAAAALDVDDVVLELGVTPNRPDVLSHLGLARELAALHELTLPRASVRVREAGRPAAELASVEVEDAARCPRYLGRVVTGVKVGPSPAWVRRRLKAVGLRSISNVVDATNLVLLELGHPLHAFDLSRLEGSRVVVRTAREGEALRTLDGVERKLSADDLVIADAARPLALAGVMGGADSEVGAHTTALLVEAALFEPGSVRRSGRRHALHTEASHRFERGVDPAMVEVALDRCAQLIVELAGGQVHPGRLASGRGAPAPRTVSIRPSRATRVLGREVSRREARAALVALGLRPTRRPAARGGKAPKDDALAFVVPTWRVDLGREEDLIEEVARLGGFDRIPTLPPPGAGIAAAASPPGPDARAREALVGEGFLEAVSLAFTSKALAEHLGLPTQHGVYVANPLGEESQLMRMSLLPALLKAARLNQDNLPSRTDLRLFEVGRTFRWGAPLGRLPEETSRVALAMRGRRFPVGWASPADPLDAHDLKGAVEALLEAFGVAEARFVAVEVPWLHPRSATEVRSGEAVLGVLGELHPAAAARFGLEGPPVFVAELDLDVLGRTEGRLARFAPLPRLPPARRDLSFFLDRGVTADRVLERIRAAGAGHLERAEVFDVYEGQGVPAGQRSLAVGLTFRAVDRTLTDREVDAAQAAIVAALEAELGARLRSGPA